MGIIIHFSMAGTVIALILSTLCLFAGHKNGFMEDYYLITLNTSTLGHDIFARKSTPAITAPTTGSAGLFLTNLANDVEDEVMGELSNITNNVVDKITDELGIHDWYSLHLMDMCYGKFEPNATDDAGKRVENCSVAKPMYHFNITGQLSQELLAGPLDIDLSDIQWPDMIQDGLNALSMASDATFIFYVTGLIGAGFAIITTLISLFHQTKRLVFWGNCGLSISSLAILIASIAVTVVLDKATGLINRYGNNIGVFANKGAGFLKLTWAAVGCMLFAVAARIVDFCLHERKSGKRHSEE
ncbi:actin cortical patch SUR7/pH-response regulator pali [Bisporella sp. PMI_857]|nr:actin cortical patch SUR7/pH-response regulator pali [Bisporella sp. PMI_857]